MALRVISLNTGGIGDQIKRRKIFKQYSDRGDILCLQETHCTNEMENIWAKEWGGVAFFANGTSAARGTAILINRKRLINVNKVQGSPDGRFLAINCELEGFKFCITSIYAPNDDSPGYFRDIMQKLEHFEAKKIIIGDFNLVLNARLDRRGSSYNNHNAANYLLQQMEEEYLCDVWRDRHPEDVRYSWYRGSGKNLQASRIDFALVSQAIANRTNDAFYIKGIGSDHAAYILSLKLTNQKRGAGYWKLNCALLQNQNYIKLMNEKLMEWKREEADSKVELWERIKTNIAKTSKSFAKGSTSERKLAISNLMEKISEMEDNLNNVSENEYEVLTNSKIDLEELTSEDARALIFRSKSQWLMEGEKNSKYFFNLERSRSEAKSSGCILHDGVEYTDNKAILEVQRSFYRDLYQRNPNVTFQLDTKPSKQVKLEKMAKSEKAFSTQEIARAVLMLNNNKTPGPDGIGIDFYKVFWRQIEDIFCEMIEEVFKSGKMCSSSSQGIINLIPKKGRDSRLLKNLRPITLLNSDYKVIEKAIAQRMVPAMEDLIHEDQRGFLPGRKIIVNIRKAFEVLKAAENQEALYISCDFQKAFDKISTESIWKTMELYGFSKYLIDWTKLLYTNFEAKVQNNGNFSEVFPIEQSVHQGAPNSCYYFILVVEILADAIRSNSNIKGFRTSEINALLNQFADDMDSAMFACNESVRNFFETIEWFKSITGLELNYDKTTIYRIGSLRNSDAKYYSDCGVQWSSGTMNILGIDVDINDDTAVDENYQKTIEKISAILSSWKTRGLSLEGKVLIINTLIVPLFVYKMSVLPNIPKGMIRKIESMWEKFLWGNNSKPKIKTEILQKERGKGGLKLVDLHLKDQALKISWVKIAHEQPEIARILYANIQPELQELIWTANLHPDDIKYVLPRKKGFWIDVLSAWCTINAQENIQPWHPIWWNSQIRVKNAPVFYKDAFKKGLIEVSQIWNGVSFITQKEASERFSLTVMQFNSLKSAIKEKINDHPNETSELLIYQLVNTKEIVKAAYGMLLARREVSDNIKAKWENDLERTISEKEMAYLFSSVKTITPNAKLHSFQYRLLRKAISTNIHLKHWKIKESDSCSFCKSTRETIRHLFVDCEKIQKLWKGVSLLVKSLGNSSQLVLDYENIMFNKIDNSRMQSTITNFICLVTKQYIYRTRCLNNIPNINELKCLIYSYKNSERYYAIKNDTLQKHCKKWLEPQAAEENQQDYIRQYVCDM